MSRMERQKIEALEVELKAALMDRSKLITWVTGFIEGCEDCTTEAQVWVERNEVKHRVEVPDQEVTA